MNIDDTPRNVGLIFSSNIPAKHTSFPANYHLNILPFVNNEYPSMRTHDIYKERHFHSPVTSIFNADCRSNWYIIIYRNFQNRSTARRAVFIFPQLEDPPVLSTFRQRI
jgi:hypothetical protein